MEARTVTDDDLPDVDALVAALADAAAEYEAAREAVSDVGEERVETVADAHRTLTGLLDRYEEDATGTGDFGSYVEFRGSFASTVEDLPDDLPRRDAFEDALSAIEKQIVGADDFDRAREELARAEGIANRLADRDAAREEFRAAEREVAAARDTLDERIADLEHLRDLGEADLDAPVDELREPVETYDEAVTEAFAAFEETAPARDVFDFLRTAADRPLVEAEAPPERLCDYADTHEAGGEPIGTLLEYADYSRSKLDHYVDDPGALRRAVATNQTYLERLDASALTVGWPPPEGSVLDRRLRELRPLVERVGGSDCVAPLRRLRDLAREERYGRLRRAAVARAELDESEVAALEAGRVAEKLERARDARDRLADALAEHGTH